MEIKKNPKSNLENYSKIFLQIGLVLALFVTYAAIEKKTYDKIEVKDLGAVNINAMYEEEIVVIQKPPKPVQPKTPPPPAPEVIEVVEDDEEIEETVIETTETDEEEEIVIDDVEEIEETEAVVEDVSFMIIEDIPVFPGCKGKRDKLMECFNKKVQRHFQRKFDANLPNELGLDSGRKRVYIGFTINNKGDIVDINARAPHPKIKQEVIKVMKLLPRMKPGKQRGKPVNVKYSIPFTLLVE